MAEEKDFLNYQGYKFPKVLRFAWTVFLLFAAYYLIKYSLPNLKQWLGGNG